MEQYNSQINFKNYKTLYKSVLLIILSLGSKCRQSWLRIFRIPHLELQK